MSSLHAERMIGSATSSTIPAFQLLSGHANGVEESQSMSTNLNDWITGKSLEESVKEPPPIERELHELSNANCCADSSGGIDNVKFRGRRQNNQALRNRSPSPAARAYKAAELFKKFNKRENGFLDRSELKLALEAMGFAINVAELQLWFAVIDSEKDGVIDKREFRNFLDDAFIARELWRGAQEVVPHTRKGNPPPPALLQRLELFEKSPDEVSLRLVSVDKKMRDQVVIWCSQHANISCFVFEDSSASHMVADHVQQRVADAKQMRLIKSVGQESANNQGASTDDATEEKRNGANKPHPMMATRYAFCQLRQIIPDVPRWASASNALLAYARGGGDWKTLFAMQDIEKRGYLTLGNFRRFAKQYDISLPEAILKYMFLDALRSSEASGEIADAEAGSRYAAMMATNSKSGLSPDQLRNILELLVIVPKTMHGETVSENVYTPPISDFEANNAVLSDDEDEIAAVEPESESSDNDDVADFELADGKARRRAVDGDNASCCADEVGGAPHRLKKSELRQNSCSGEEDDSCVIA